MDVLPNFFDCNEQLNLFKINKVFSAVPSVKGDSPPSSLVESMAKLVQLRQHDVLHRRHFQTAAIECKLRGIDGNQLRPMEVVYNNSSFSKTILVDEDADFLVCIWKSQHNGAVREVELPFCRCSKLSENMCKRKKYLKSKFVRMSMSLNSKVLSFPFAVTLRDSCIVADAENQGCLLTYSANGDSIASMINCFDNVSTSFMFKQKLLSKDDETLSCAYNKASRRAAFGMNKYGLVYTWDGVMEPLTKTQSDGSSLFCMEFDSTGQILYGGSRNGAIFRNDLRCDPGTKYDYKVELHPHGIRTLRVLKNDFQMVVSGENHQLLNIDLRVMRCLLSYDEHVCSYQKIPFSVNEELGVLCSMGEDCRTRLWNLNSGQLLNTIKLPVSIKTREMPSAGFINTWGKTLRLPTVLTSFKDDMYIYHI